jgi:hypothetical protein
MVSYRKPEPWSNGKRKKLLGIRKNKRSARLEFSVVVDASCGAVS